MTKKNFIGTFYTQIGESYFSRYDLAEIGFAPSDAGWCDKEELNDSFKLFKSDRAKWLEEYAWSDDDYQKAHNIDWLKPYIEE